MKRRNECVPDGVCALRGAVFRMTRALVFYRTGMSSAQLSIAQLSIAWAITVASATFSLPAHAQDATESADAAADEANDDAGAQSSTGPAPRGAVLSRELTVQEGETLSSIARRELGRAGLTPLLAEFNSLDANATLSAGQIIQIPFFAIAQIESAVVLFVKGEVTRANRPLNRGEEVYIDDLLSTGATGFVSLEFSSGSIINLQPNTRATLTQLNCLPDDASCVVQFETDAGELNSEVEQRDGQPAEFRILTPYSSAAVRGTVFDFNASASEMRVGVTEGEVDLSALDVTVPLETGFGSVTVEGEPPGDPEALPAAPRFRYIPSRVTTDDVLRWWELPNAEQYQAKLSEDPEGTRVLAAYQVQDTGLSIVDQPPGDYHITVRGLTGSQLAGFGSTSRLAIARIDPALPAVSTRIERLGNAFLVEVTDPPQDTPGFEIQVAVDEAFTTPISVDVGTVGSAIIQIESDVLYARARQLIDPQTVSAYGDVSVIR